MGDGVILGWRVDSISRALLSSKLAVISVLSSGFFSKGLLDASERGEIPSPGARSVEVSF